MKPKWILTCIALGILSCGKNKPYPFTESVLSQGMVISAITTEGPIEIRGGPRCARIFSGPNWSKEADLIPRQKRWYGSLGLYGPSPSNSPSVRLVVDEGCQFFSSESEALRYINSLSKYYGKIPFSKSGLVVAYKVIDIPGSGPSRNIAVWQIYINGKQPVSLRGGNDSAISVRGGSIPQAAWPHEAFEGYPRALSVEEYSPTE